ncbi:MAG: S-adenosylmethionine:tRNA ribosyltransferase-isomerase [Porphyromonadaceae bacterium]|jgi:S-adenosylmethionine:tRNA ribosyltransferase-isomerase|nr:S-adenosylmethionine:tRNA ribosyltransferase-isomerase [Porphyromonadaceae bacterium]
MSQLQISDIRHSASNNFSYFCANLLKLFILNELIHNDPLRIEDFNYQLPDEKIAKYPLAKRDESKLLIYKNGNISESKFSHISDILPENCLLVCNNTRVIHARLVFFKPTGARIEVFCLEPAVPSDYVLSLTSTTGCVWNCMVGNLKKWKEKSLSQTISIDNKDVQFTAERLSSNDNSHQIKFSWDNNGISFSEILEKIGELPIPPYLNRKTESSDKETYQTVYSKIEGSVAAPTAGLHFTDEVLMHLVKKKIEIEELTLHVGAGTFQPVKSEDIADHVMHTEAISVPLKTLKHIQNKLGNIIAVGTTSVRTLESLYYLGSSLNPTQGGLITNSQPLQDFSSRIKEIRDSEILKVGQWEPYLSNEISISAYDALQNIINYLEKRGQDTLHAETQILIKPGFQFRIINGMITNFHQPKSTLLLLVSAFVGEKWKEIYDYALENDFRFLSYGDSSVMMKPKQLFTH